MILYQGSEGKFSQRRFYGPIRVYEGTNIIKGEEGLKIFENNIRKIHKQQHSLFLLIVQHPLLYTIDLILSRYICFEWIFIQIEQERRKEYKLHYISSKKRKEGKKEIHNTKYFIKLFFLSFLYGLSPLIIIILLINKEIL